MPLSLNDLKRLLKILGPKGTIAGIRESDVNLLTLRALAMKAKISLRSNTSRSDIIESIVTQISGVNLKPTDQLMGMSYDELLAYFNDIAPSTEDLLRVMRDLNYKVGSEDKKHLRRFVARQISETALFSGVAKREIDSDR